MTNQPETKPLINFDLAEEVPGHVGFLNVCITNASTGGNSEETYLTLNTEDFGGGGIYVKIDGETVEAGEVQIKLYGALEFMALLQGMGGFLKYYEKRLNKISADMQALTEGSNGTSADDIQYGGTHYKDMAIQPWAVMESVLTPQEFIGYLKGNIIKYSLRQGKKDSPDADKAKHYMQKLKEFQGEW